MCKEDFQFTKNIFVSI